MPLTYCEVEGEQVGHILPVWEFPPYRLVSWWTMLQFSARAYYQIGRLLQQVKTDYELAIVSGDAVFGDSAANVRLTQESADGLREFMKGVQGLCAVIGLDMSIRQTEDIRQKAATLTNAQATNEIEQLDKLIRWEMEKHLFMFIPPARATCYANPLLFGQDCVTRFPSTQFDIEHAGNCYAFGEGTACVFHLMRILETGVQELGTALGVSLANEKNWQNILDEINKSIKTLPAKDRRTVELSQAAGNLYSVKLAWRNQVMHPKATYTLEEAGDIMGKVRSFIQHLATII